MNCVMDWVIFEFWIWVFELNFKSFVFFLVWYLIFEWWEFVVIVKLIRLSDKI